LPYRIDLFALFILLGIVQAVFLSTFFLSVQNRQKPSNLYHGLILIGIACILLEIFTMYSGYIVHAFWLVDSSESIGLVLGPLFYMYALSLAGKKFGKVYLWHFVPFVLYTVQLAFFLALPEDAKYNAWIHSYHPQLPERDFDYPYNADPFGFRDNISALTLVSILGYGILCLIETNKAFKKSNDSFFKATSVSLRSLRRISLVVLSVFLTVFLVKVSFPHDTGDHIFAAYIAFTVYLTSFSVIRDSSFFHQEVLAENKKYKSSGLKTEDMDQLLEKMKDYLEKEKPYLSNQFSQPQLASALGTTVHQLSQSINDGLKKSFFEMVAEYRMEAAKQLLKSKSYQHLKIEEIAEMVGYSSKSSFNTAFKKITGQTPSEFKNT